MPNSQALLVWLVGCLAAALGLALGPPAQLTVVGPALVGLVVLFDCRSPSLGPLGSFRLGAPVWLVGLLEPQAGPVWALTGVLAGCGLRAMFISPRLGRARWVEEGQAFLTAALVVLVAGMLPPGLGQAATATLLGAVYLAVVLLALPALGATPPNFLGPIAQVGLAVTGSLLLERNPLLLLGLLPLPGLLGSVAVADETTRLAAGAEQARVEARTRARALEDTRRRLKTTAGALEVTRQEFSVLARLGRCLALAPDLQACLEEVLTALQDLSGAANVVFFAPEEGRLMPVAWHSPLPLDEVSLLGLREPVVEQAWQSGKPSQQAGDRNGIFIEDRWRAAYPVANLGVLYAGGYEPPLPDHLCRLVADQAAVGIQAAQRVQRQREDLEQLVDRHGKVVGRLELLSVLWRHSASIAASLEPAQEFRRAMSELIAFDECLVWRSQESLPEGGLGELLKVAQGHGRPLLYGDTSTSPFAPGPRWRSLVAVPFETGWVVLGAEATDRFSAEHQEIVANLAVALGSALTGTELRQQLVHRSKMAAIGQLAAGVAHELNSPLASLKLRLDMARRHPPQAESMLESADKSLLQAQTIISSLLTYSRETSGTLVRFDLAELASEVLGVLELQLGGLKPGRDLEPAPADGIPSQIEQVLTNLLLNARDSLAQTAEPRLLVRTRPGRLEVEDNGPGIAPELLSRIFEPFFTTKPVGCGTGLGLSISARLVERQGGTMTVDSRPGCTIFRIELPGPAAQ